MKKGCRIDANQGPIVAALRALGCPVLDLTNTGYGMPDLLVGYQRKLFLLEIKNPKTYGKLTPAQEKFHREWEGYPVFVVRSIEDAFRVLGAAVRIA